MEKALRACDVHVIRFRILAVGFKGGNDLLCSAEWLGGWCDTNQSFSCAYGLILEERQVKRMSVFVVCKVMHCSW